MPHRVEKKRMTLEVQSSPARLDQTVLLALVREGIELSRNQLKQMFLENRIHHVTPRPPFSLKAATLLNPGKYEIELEFIVQSSSAARASDDFKVPILYEDEGLLILNKTSGVPSLPHSGEETGTAVNFALNHFPALATVGKASGKAEEKQRLEPGLIHRLDTETSGVLVFAKNDLVYHELSNLWKNRRIRKFYRAIVTAPSGSFQNLPLKLDLPLGHDRDSSKKMIALQFGTDPRQLKKLRGKPLPAITHLLSALPISSFLQKTSRDNNFGIKQHQLWDLTLEIETGVMHQIRCHLASQQWPIVGDPIYRGLQATRLWLHAWKLEIPEWIDPQNQIHPELKLVARLPEGWPGQS